MSNIEKIKYYIIHLKSNPVSTTIRYYPETDKVTWGFFTYEAKDFLKSIDKLKDIRDKEKK